MSAKLFCIDQFQRNPTGAVRHEALKDWMETQTRVLGFWMDRLIEEGDSEDLVSLLHRQHAWMAMMQDRLARG